MKKPISIDFNTEIYKDSKTFKTEKLFGFIIDKYVSGGETYYLVDVPVTENSSEVHHVLPAKITKIYSY